MNGSLPAQMTHFLYDSSIHAADVALHTEMEDHPANRTVRRNANPPSPPQPLPPNT